MSDRCTRSNANAAWTCVLPEGHEGDHIYTLWSEIAIHAEAAIQRVRGVCEQDSFWINHAKTGGWGRALTVSQVLKALDSDQ